MSAQRLVATMAWTQLVIAMREDGIISKDVTQSGPATTAVIMELCKDDQWFPMTFKPAIGKQVVAATNTGSLHVLEIDSCGGGWLHSVNKSYANPKLFDKWTFVKVPK